MLVYLSSRTTNASEKEDVVELFNMVHSNDEYVELNEFKTIYEVYLAFLSSFSNK